jgi:5-(carboxyamino)imidazole ribonucleotide synthase
MTTIGVLGAGQLGRMLALAGIPLGLRFAFYDPNPEAPAAGLGELHCGGWDDAARLDAFAAGCDVVTYEFENVPVDVARRIAGQKPVHPAPGALAAAQDRASEKALFSRLGIATAPHANVDGLPDLERAIVAIGLPAVLKTRREGYDGKGQRVLREASDAASALAALGGRDLILEGFVPFTRELSILAVRGADGATAFWPVVENVHREGILRISVAPARADAELAGRAVELSRLVLEHLGYVGVLAIELFEHDGRLIANEMAPRVHNSGHWTIEGAATSQFENHVRAVTGWPLGGTQARGVAAMVNLIGTVPPAEAVLRVAGAHLHVYGKSARPGRKLGHVTFVGPARDAVDASLRRLAEVVAEPALPR